MDWVESLGYVAAGVIFVTFGMKTLIPLRMVAILGNALYLCYGIYADLGNIILLHGALLPLNCLRLRQAIQLREKIRDMAHAEFDVRRLLAFMSRHECPEGATLFAQGDEARDIYYLIEGRVRVDGLGLDVGPGNLIGEIAVFTPEKRRTQTVTCAEASVFMRITEDKALELYAENPEFGLYLTKMMIERLLANAQRAPETSAA